MQATEFSYGGVYSGSYGLKIASFDASNVEDSTPFSAILQTTKTARGNRFSFSGISYDEPPQMQFSIISATPISNVLRRELLAWLTSRKGFKDLQFHEPSLEEYTFRCVFAEVGLVYVNNDCIGINLTATFDSPFAYGKPRTLTIKSENYEKDSQGFLCKIKMVGDKPTYVYPKIINESDVIDDWTYPLVRFTQVATIKDIAPDGTIIDDEEKSIIIINNSDTTYRVFKIDALGINEKVEVDNELKIITHADDSISNSGDLLGKFNKEWIRLRKGVNEIKAKIDGEITIICPHFALIGF